MSSPTSIVIRNSEFEAAAHCLVCGSDITAGEGVTARYGERTLRFKCMGCLRRFEANPESFLAGQTGGCCDGAHDHSPASEWSQ